jgi:PHP family Zn ribbon phosphoesterase
MHCPTQAGGCGAEITADSREEAMEAWDRRPEPKLKLSDAFEDFFERLSRNHTTWAIIFSKPLIKTTWKSAVEAVEEECLELREKVRALTETLRGLHTHQCVRCDRGYTPLDNESEDCPFCGCTDAEAKSILDEREKLQA